MSKYPGDTLFNSIWWGLVLSATIFYQIIGYFSFKQHGNEPFSVSVHAPFSYHLEDVIVGKIYFQLVRVKIKYMEVQILRRESTGLGAVNTFTDMETLAKFEIMDGAPVRGECIPIRLFLGAYTHLTPTAKDVNRKFSVRYYLNLVLLDEEERRYYKQHVSYIYLTIYYMICFKLGAILLF